MPFYTTVRGRLSNADPKTAMEVHNGIVARVTPRNEQLGATGHRVFANVQDPMEFLALDTWENVEGLQQAFGNPDTQAEIGSMFDGAPEVTIWSPREGWTAF
jgi:hypothetical protein